MQRRRLRRQDGRASPAPATWPSTPREKAQQLGAKVVTMSDSTGWVVRRRRASTSTLRQADQGSRARPPHRVRQAPPRARRVPRGPRRVERPLRHRPALRHPERAASSRTPRASSHNGCIDRRRGRQHAHHPRGHRVPAGARRRCSPRARLPTPAAWPPPAWRCPRTPSACPGPSRRLTRSCKSIMESIFHAADDAAKRVRPRGQLRHGRQHRRLHQGRRRHDGPGHRVIGRAARRRYEQPVSHTKEPP